MEQDHNYSMPGMVYTPVEIGTIRLGHIEDHNGRPTPVKDDKFSITRLVRRKSGWVLHPLQEELLSKLPPPQEGAAERKLREIPIRIMYDSPDLTVRSRLEAFDAKRKRPVCASTAAGKARRIGTDGPQEVECVGPDECAFAKSEGIRCKFFGRITVQIEGQREADNGFVLRSTSVNTLRNFEAKLARYWALFGRRLTGVPFRLILRTKTTSASFWQPFYFCDLELPAGMTLQHAVKLARDHAAANADAGLDVQAWEAMVRAGLGNGALAAASDIEADLMDEFYVDAGQGEDGADRYDEGGSSAGADQVKERKVGPALTLKAGLADKGPVLSTADPLADGLPPPDHQHQHQPAHAALSGAREPAADAAAGTGHDLQDGAVQGPPAGTKLPAAAHKPAVKAARPPVAPRLMPPSAPAPASASQRPPVRQNPPALRRLTPNLR